MIFHLIVKDDTGLRSFLGFKCNQYSQKLLQCPFLPNTAPPSVGAQRVREQKLSIIQYFEITTTLSAQPHTLQQASSGTVLGFDSNLFIKDIWLSSKQSIHTWQACGVSPVCHMTWFIKCSFRVKDFLHISHRWGVSPVCLRTWFTMCSLRVNVLAQYWQR